MGNPLRTVTRTTQASQRDPRRVRLRYANVTSTLALVLALGGTSYAALTLPAHSVGPRQLRPRAVTAGALASGSVSPRSLGIALGGASATSNTPISLAAPCAPNSIKCPPALSTPLVQVSLTLHRPGAVLLEGTIDVQGATNSAGPSFYSAALFTDVGGVDYGQGFTIPGAPEGYTVPNQESVPLQTYVPSETAGTHTFKLQITPYAAGTVESATITAIAVPSTS